MHFSQQHRLPGLRKLVEEGLPATTGMKLLPDLLSPRKRWRGEGLVCGNREKGLGRAPESQGDFVTQAGRRPSGASPQELLPLRLPSHLPLQALFYFSDSLDASSLRALLQDTSGRPGRSLRPRPQRPQGGDHLAFIPEEATIPTLVVFLSRHGRRYEAEMAWRAEETLREPRKRHIGYGAGAPWRARPRPLGGRNTRSVFYHWKLPRATAPRVRARERRGDEDGWALTRLPGTRWSPSRLLP